MSKHKKSKLPSRQKYEEEHPTVSARISRKTYDSLRRNLARTGMSLADALKVLAGELEVKMKPIDEVRQQAFDEGEESGIERAIVVHAVSYKCVVCGEEIVVVTDEEKNAIRKYMRDNGWGHRGCLEKRGRL